MWEPYLRTKLPAPTEQDRDRLEAFAGGPLPAGYWALATAHQGEALDEDLVRDPSFPTFILLLVAPLDRLEKAERSYAIAFAIDHMMPRYPAGLLPFADDTGGNLFAFDYRADPAAPSIVFIDHELDGEDGITPVAPDFASLLRRIGLTPP
ncbi:SMI1/KNR4 family protein [Sphingomonas arantia]|uniref:SMI1/KNR4 family protein n=1 Tax=Sphingomonas arantia TaxID=1460676 RepID=A0ABW4TWE7_9SPHN